MAESERDVAFCDVFISIFHSSLSFVAPKKQSFTLNVVYQPDRITLEAPIFVCSTKWAGNNVPDTRLEQVYDALLRYSQCKIDLLKRRGHENANC